MRKFGLNFIFVILAVVFMSSTAFAVTPERETRYEEAIQQVAAETEKEPAFSHKVESFYRYMPVAHVEHQDGKVGLMEAGSEYELEFKAFDKFPVSFSLNAGYIGVNNSTVVPLPAKLTATTADVEITLPFFKVDKTHFRFGISPSLFGDDWNFKPSNFRIPSRYYMIHQPNDKLTFILGLAYFPQYRDQFMPIAGLVYEPNDKWAFNIVPPRPTIVYSLNSKISLFAEAGMDSDEYEVDYQNTHTEILEYSGNRAGAGINYEFNKHVECSFSVGGTFGRQLKYRESFGKVNVDDGMYAEFRIVASI
ncbi:MAG: DUF6268 family outer membrane beta-barrel protein [Candidatus Omnitrophota bacterium]